MKKTIAVLLVVLVAFTAFAEFNKESMDIGGYLGKTTGFRAGYVYGDKWEFGAFAGTSFPKTLFDGSVTKNPEDSIGTVIKKYVKVAEIGADALYTVFEKDASKIQVGARASVNADITSVTKLADLKDKYAIDLGAEVSYRYTIDKNNRAYVSFVLPVLSTKDHGLQSFIDGCKAESKGILKTVFENLYIGYSYKF